MIKPKHIHDWLMQFADLAAAQAEQLDKLDRPIGDGDHGTNLLKGAQAAVAAMGTDSVSSQLKNAGKAFTEGIGGASGPLYGLLFTRAGEALEKHDAEVTDSAFADALRKGLNSLVLSGRADLGDKTMVDALSPAINEFKERITAGAERPEAARAAAREAAKGRDATENMPGKKGLAKTVSDQAAGHIDSGAASAALLFEALAEVR